MPIKRNIPEDQFFGQDEDPWFCADDISDSSEEEPEKAVGELLEKIH